MKALKSNGVISIIIGFRNRETERVRNLLESVRLSDTNNVELLFIDYGSDEAVSEKVKILLKRYGFARYIFSDTRGQYWNRAHALNTGIKMGSGDIIILADIDLVFPERFVESVSRLDFENRFYIFKCYYLNQAADPLHVTPQDLNEARISYVGLCAVKTESLLDVSGFDEYYMKWGGEDDDLYKRLENTGCKKQLLEVQDFPVLHQWHPNHAPEFPTPWYLETIQRLYAEPKAEKELGFGKVINTSNRPVMNALEDTNKFKPFELYGNPWLQFNYYYIGFEEMKSGDFGVFKFPDRKPAVSHPIGRKQKVVNKLNVYFKKWNFPYTMEKLSKPDPEMHTRERWQEFMTFFIGKNRKYLTDYYLLDTPEQLALYFQKK